MNHGRWCQFAAVMLTAGLLAIAGFTLAQPATIHRNGFEGKVAWIKGGGDAAFDETAHKIDDRDPHNGRGSEYIEFDAKKGNAIYYSYPIGKAIINDDLRCLLWFRGNRPGARIMARVVLPNERDPNNLDYRLTTYLHGDTYTQPGQWQVLELSRPVQLAKKQQQIMNAKGEQEKPKRSYDFTGAYIDQIVMNVYSGPGATKIWIDDLEVGPVQAGPFQTADRVDSAKPAKNVSLPRRANAVEFNANRILVGNKRMFFRAIRYTDTLLPVLRDAGFNTICFDRNVNAALVNEAAELGLWVVPEFRVTNDQGTALSPDEVAKQIQRFADNDAVLFHRVGGVLAYENSMLVSRSLQAARGVDPMHAFSGDVWDGMLPYSRSLNLLGTTRFPLMTTMELPKYREWLEARRRLANPGVFTWTWIQTHLPDWYADLLYNQDARAEFKDPVGPQPEQIRLLTYTAISSGCRGLAYWSDRFLADSHQGRDRLLSCALLNQEMDMLESLLVTVEDPPVWIDTNVIDVKAAVMRCDKGVLVLPIWQGKFSQFVPGQAAVSKLIMTVPQVPKTAQAWEVSPGDVRGLKIERVDKGVRVTLPEFGLTSAVVFTADTNLMGRFQDQARAQRKVAGEWAYQMAQREYEKAVEVQAKLDQMGVTIADSNGLMEDAKNRLQKSRDLWMARNFGEAYHEANRALRPVRILMRAQWEKAVRGMDTPVASPYAVSFYTLPRHWQFMDQIRRSTVGANLLPGGDFETPPERTQESWKKDETSLDDLVMIAERVSELKVARVEGTDIKPATKDKKPEPKLPPSPMSAESPIEGKQCAMLQIKPKEGKLAPAAVERTHVSLSSAPVKLPPGSLVQISGWVNIPTPITASPDGAMMFDSSGGEPLAIRWTEPTPWKKYTVFRRVPASGMINVTLTMTGVGTVYFDDIRIEPLAPAR